MPDTTKLLSMLESGNVSIRERAAKMILQGHDVPLPTLLDIADQFSDRDFAEMLVEKLCAHNASAVALRNRLLSPSPSVREMACKVLGRTRDADAMPLLLPLITDPEPRVRAAATHAIGQLGDSPAIERHVLPRVCHYDELPLHGKTSFFEPFPDPNAVFSQEPERHARYILPLATVEVGQIDPGFPHRVHFLMPIEPADGFVGENRKAHHNYLCRENYVGYQYSDGKCRLATTFKFFRLSEVQTDFESSNDIDLNLADHYERVRNGFLSAREEYRQRGMIRQVGTERPVRMAEQIGGRCVGGNWAESGDFPLLRGAVTLPLTQDGRAFIFIGSVNVSSYVHVTSFDCDLLLFYDPGTRQSLTTFDWT
jgi:hypothetical protein